MIGDGRLRGIDLTLYGGEIFGLFGLVGAGRTELLELLLGVRPMKQGRILLHGRPWRPASPAASIAAGIALLPEGRKLNGLLPNRAVSENLSLTALPRIVRRLFIDRGQEAGIVRQACQELGIVLRDARQPIRTLSGGNQQKCILARCLAANPRVLLLDEPTHGVDVRTKEQIYEILRRLAGQGMAILLASSEMQELLQIADRILVLSDGRAAGLHVATETTPVALMRDAFRHL